MHKIRFISQRIYNNTLKLLFITGLTTLLPFTHNPKLYMTEGLSVTATSYRNQVDYTVDIRQPLIHRFSHFGNKSTNT